MWETMRALQILFFILLSSILANGADSAHLAELKSKFPNGLLSDDHGVLNIKDLALNACRLKPPAFAPGATNTYEYWICFENKSILPTCYDAGVDETEGHVGRVYIDTHDSEMSYKFFERRPWPIRDCRNFVKALRKIMKGTLHACISASSITMEEKNDRGQMERVGFLHRFKTRKGCEGEECELTKKFKKRSQNFWPKSLKPLPLDISSFAKASKGQELRSVHTHRKNSPNQVS
jgi:hypothetical protein